MNQPTEIVVYDPVSYALMHGEGSLIFAMVILWGAFFVAALILFERPLRRFSPNMVIVIASLIASVAEYSLYRYLS